MSPRAYPSLEYSSTRDFSQQTPFKQMKSLAYDSASDSVLKTPKDLLSITPKALRRSPRFARHTLNSRPVPVPDLNNCSKKFKIPKFQLQDTDICLAYPDFMLFQQFPDLPSSSISERREQNRRRRVSCPQLAEQYMNSEINGSDSSSCFFISSSEYSEAEKMRNVCNLYKQLRKISAFYDWQDQCLSDEHLLSGSNMILSVTTGAGKTVIAEVLMLREIIIRKKSCIFILPYVAIVQEKIRSLSLFEDKFDVCVEEYAGNKGRFPPVKRRKNVSIYVATIEKANMLINSLIETNRIDEIGVVVVDELHMIGENGRGAILEQGLIKIMRKGAGQVLGMSATISNLDQLSRFLQATVFTTKFRPVKLVEKVKIGRSLYLVNEEGKLEFEMSLAENKLRNRDPDGLVSLLKDIVPKRSVLIFCPTKQNCENVCKMVSYLVPKNVCERKKTERQAAVEALKSEEDGKFSSFLELSIMRGVAYHHSGLTADERRIIESAFQDGVINIICCTSTLAAGVNLPARRIIIKAPFVGKNLLSKAQYLQMIGRAGRAGYDNIGEAVTILHSGCEESKFLEMISGPIPRCNSSLNDSAVFSSLVLDLISLKIAERLEQLETVVQQTLLGIQDSSNSKVLLKRTLSYLTEHDLINVDKGVVLSSNFHLILMMVPFDIDVDVDWNIFYDENGSEPSLRVYISFMLHRLWKQETFFDVAERFHVSRGWLQNVLQSTISHASSIARFSEKIPSLWPLKNLIPDLVQHMRNCSHKELIPLLALDCVKKGRALQLYNAGFKTIASIASTEPSLLLSAINHLNKQQASSIIKSARVILRDQLAEKIEQLEEEVGANAAEILAKFLVES
ncbi:unnamed protein product [Thelazia callipaeda]|uniref:Helicase POLQ-like n=1 Tax=Thelazia callipaeda TaxID=103827 RepID=A0A158RB03_THECL|nr:unnamed protein product [Thelazia callipaeda]